MYFNTNSRSPRNREQGTGNRQEAKINYPLPITSSPFPAMTTYAII
ncbi:MAG: hypothetical protein HEQ13_24310 [Dolichospermum sp. DEX189]|nr:hypothetical protein [Dolichospermum sp. DEX189]